MTLEELKAKVQKVIDYFHVSLPYLDHEALHSEEDGMYKAVLRAVAEGHPESQALAKEVLRLSELDFQR